MSEPVIRTFADRDSLDAMLATTVAERLAEAISSRGRGWLVVSGGSTPLGFFSSLAAQPLDWSRVTVTLADDRWVSGSHDDSNERLVRERLLAGPATAATFVSLVTEAVHPAEAVEEVAGRLAQAPTFDVVILGMGGDGHFASLFPGAINLGEGLDLAQPGSCIAVDPPLAPHPRMSLTLRRLLDTRSLFVHVVGEDKRRVLETAAREQDAQTLPIAAVLAATDPRPTIYWSP